VRAPGSDGATSPTTTPYSDGNGTGSPSTPFGSGSGSGGSGTTSEGSGGPTDVSTIAARVDPAVVDVNVTFNYQSAEGAGTGIVLTSNGLVLTNNHVIDQATKISVTDVGNGKTYVATVVGYDNTDDVALLKLQGASGLTTAKIATASASVGEAVVAIGNAGGTGGTPTSAGGSVTALDQSITASDELTDGSEQLSGLIEVNANVESGDSGGPLVNAAGQVIGMDTAASAGFAFSAQGNQGFAIPVQSAMKIVKQIESNKGTATVHVGPTAFLGLLVEPVSSDEPPYGGNGYGNWPYSYPYGGDPLGSGGQFANATGVGVAQVVPGTPAQKVGLAEGDVITTLNGKTLSSEESLTHMLVAYHPGQKVTIVWVTPSGETRQASVTLASGPPA
jgi:S1-C subfamily serine protease